MSNTIPPRALDAFFDAMVNGPEGAIERQEAREQQKSAALSLIARRMSPEEKTALQAMGVVFIEEGRPATRDTDPVLQQVQLPEGWKLVPTDHHMYSNLVDADGGKRALCGYKGAFYDRWASIRVLRRYKVEDEYGPWPKDNGHAATRCKAVDTKTGAALFETDMSVVDYDDDSKRAACVAYLDEHFPQWADPLAYWSAP